MSASDNSKGDCLVDVSSGLPEKTPGQALTEVMSMRSSGEEAKESTGALLLRQFSPDGGFLRNIICQPGEILVLLVDEENYLEPFRQALLGERPEVPVSMRLGNRELHISEIHQAFTAGYLGNKNLVSAVATQVGIAPEEQSDFLAELGLEHDLSQPLDSLTPSAQRRFALATAFLVKSQVLVFDRPFLGMEGPWVTKMSQYMLAKADSDRRIVIITGMNRITVPWREHVQVNIQNSRGRQIRRRTWEEEEFKEPIVKLRSMLQRVEEGKSRRDSIFTRPQTVHFSRLAQPETIQSEAIVNPNLTDSQKLKIQGEFQPSSEKTSPEKKERSKSGSRSTSGILRGDTHGKLTKVTGVHRFQRSLFWMGLKFTFRNLKATLFPNSSFEQSLLLCCKLEQERKNRKLKICLYITLAILGFLFLVWFFV